MAADTDASSYLPAAVEAARRAAALIRAAAADPASIEVRAKQPNDFVTQVDLASERAIAETLLRAHPTHAIRGEEGVAVGRADSHFVWIVDPLDGTKNFIHGYPGYAVSIALAVQGVVQVGVVLDVPRQRLYSAVRGAGASCDGRRLAVSRCATLGAALVASTCPLPRGAGFEPAWRVLGRVLERASALRRSGSAALDLAQVAEGVCDASFDRGLAAWDVAAGSLLVQEAGGVVSTFGGDPGFLEGRECLAANAALHAELRAILGAHSTTEL